MNDDESWSTIYPSTHKRYGHTVEVVTRETYDRAVEGVYACPQGHRSSVTRFPNHHGVRRCFFCGEVAEKIR